MDTNLILAKHVDRWKLKFGSLNIPKQIGLGLVLDWARETGCSQDYKLIATCLNFMESEAQVSIATLTPNILNYLPTLYHFVAQKIKEQSQESLMHIYNNRQEDQKDYSDIKDSDVSVYSSPIQNIDSEVEGNHSFISTSHNPFNDIAGKSKKDEFHNSPSPSWETARGIDVIAGENIETIMSMEIDKDSTHMKKRGRSENN